VISSLCVLPRSFVPVAAALALSTLGCDGPNHVPPAAADATVARSALETALGAWKQGASSDDLAKNTPPIVVADDDWFAQVKLIDFTLLPGEEAAGVSIRWPVRLTLSSGSKQRSIDVVYVIATSPAIHIARAD
jgi:hypothetical protein